MSYHHRMSMFGDDDPIPGQIANLSAATGVATVTDLQRELNRFSPGNAVFGFATKIMVTGVVDAPTIARTVWVMVRRGTAPGGEDIARDAGKLLAMGATPAIATTWITANLAYVVGIARGLANASKMPPAERSGPPMTAFVIGAAVVLGFLVMRKKGRR